MIEQPLISIITICYNAKEEIAKTIDSVRSQNFTDYEHLIIDGCSVDGTIDVVNSKKNNKMRFLSEPDEGLYFAMNKGLNLAKGRYVLFLNSGDVFHSPDTLSLFANKFNSDPDIIYGDTLIVDSDNNVLGPRHLNVPEKLTVKSFSKGMLICHQAFMVKKELAPLYDTSYRLSSDYDWTIKCIKKSDPDRCINLYSVVVNYLDGGLTKKKHLKSLKERFSIMSRHYGLMSTIFNHAGFIIRAMRRKITSSFALLIFLHCC